MKVLVLDTSFAAKLFIAGLDWEFTTGLFSKYIEDGYKFVVPQLLWYELNHVMVKEQIPEEEIRRHRLVLWGLVENGILRFEVPKEEILSGAVNLAKIKTKDGGYISTYDATFHALALELGCDFLTADKKHWKKTKDVLGNVILIDELKESA